MDEKISWELCGTHLVLTVRKCRKLMIPLEWSVSHSAYYVAELNSTSNLRYHYPQLDTKTIASARSLD